MRLKPINVDINWHIKPISLFVAGWLAALSGCSTPEKPEVLPVSKSLQLSSQEIQHLRARAEGGDGDSALRLYRYYHVIVDDQNQAFTWLLKAAECGNNIAEYNLGILYSGKVNSREKNRQKALYWLRKAMQDGNQLTKDELELLDE